MQYTITLPQLYYPHPQYLYYTFPIDPTLNSYYFPLTQPISSIEQDNEIPQSLQQNTISRSETLTE